MKRFALLVCFVLALAIGNAIPTDGATPAWRLKFSDDFDTAVTKGRFTDCNHAVDTPAAYCGGLTGATRTNWWAYPKGWPDTATQRGYPVGGLYDPATTVWISGGQMHIRMWRGPSGSVHSATVVPKKLMGQRYGKYEERFRVSKVAVGYKSAHLLWPVDDDACPNCEIDYPELEWNTTIHAFTHPKGGGQQSFNTGAKWTTWHTTVVEWKPGSVTYFLDGKQVGRSTRNIPDTSANWDIQNESALNGDRAALNSSAQMDIDYVRGWTWN